MKRNVMILLALCAAVAGAWARQVKGGGTVEDVKTIDVTASRFQFEPATITVAEGDRVRLRLHSADRTHGIAFKAFHVKAPIPKAGEAVTVEFVAEQTGSFDITCSEYCGTGHAGMKGRLVVLAASPAVCPPRMGHSRARPRSREAAGAGRRNPRPLLLGQRSGARESPRA